MAKDTIRTTVEPFIKEEDGILKLHEFEKHYIVECLKKEIAEAEKQNEQIKAEGWTGTGLVFRYINDLKVVLQRVEAMPSTRW